ncbi:SRPBCC family protein [Arthrobacter agilis]|uniref:SRPBCC family protein n=1 Tax=Arthrobacter agilis TaxID=37921 RepID=UPI002367145A|nr:SRPBCC family protein [Arthrobacter agilis]WDF32151.1 SRPBCC family protein [Arthrobacter agilis]
MITVSGSISTVLPPEQAFAFLSEFENTSTWDPGTPVLEKRSDGPAAIGHRYHAEADFRGKRQSIEYEIRELRPGHIQLRGENKTVIAFDSVDVVPSTSLPGGSDVTYTAEFGIKGFLKLAQPFMGPAFMSLRDPALNGLKAKLDSLAGPPGRR